MEQGDVMTKKEKKQKLNMEKTTGTGFDYLVYFEDGYLIEGMTLCTRMLADGRKVLPSAEKLVRDGCFC